MMTNRDEIIDRYLAGEMSEQERSAFETEISSDKELATEVRLQREIIRGVRRHALRELLDTERKKLSERPKRGLSMRIIAPVITIAASLFIALYVHIDNRSECIALAPNLTMDDMRGAVELSQIAELIEQQNYDQAAAKMRSIRISSGENWKCKVSAKMRSENPASFPQSEEGEYQRYMSKFISDNLEWFDLTIMMKQGRWYQSQRLLRSIANSDSYYSDAAKSLLSEM